MLASMLRSRRALSSLAKVTPLEAQEAIELTWTDGFSAKFHKIWLRDHCTCPQCQHPSTKQRQIHSATIPLSSPATMAVAPDALTIQWKDTIVRRSTEVYKLMHVLQLGWIFLHAERVLKPVAA